MVAGVQAPAQTAPPESHKTAFRPWLVVLLILVSVACLRLRLLDTPLERDEGEYAYAGQLILQGIPPYELAYNMKLPGTYFAYAAGMAVFGQTPAGVHLTLVVVNSLTSIFVFLLGRRLFGVLAGLSACTVFAFMSLSPAVLGLSAHATQFVVLCATPGVWLLWAALSTGRKRTLFLAGLLLGMAILMKQPGLCFALFALVMLTWQAGQQRVILTRAFALTMCCFGLGLVLPLAFFGVATILAGDFGRFYFWVFGYASAYAGELTLAEGGQLLLGYIRDACPYYAGFWLLAAAGLLAALRAPEKRKALQFSLVFFACSFLGTTPGLYFREHYFVLLLPAFALVLGGGIEQWARRSPGWRRWVPPGLLVLVLAVSMGQNWLFWFRWTPEEVCLGLYRGNPFRESQLIAQYIRDHSKPDARMAVLGSEPQLYFLAQRHSVTGYIYTYPLMEKQPYATFMQKEMIQEIETAKPEFLVLVTYRLSWLSSPDSNLAIRAWMRRYATEFYDPVLAFHQRPDGRTELADEAAASQFSDPPAESMVLYRRKPVP